MARAPPKDGLNHGVFSDPTYISLGDPYVKKRGKKGEKLKPIAVPKGGRNFDERPPRVFKGEAYFDAVKHQRIEEARSKKKQITYKFTPSGATGKDTFSGPIPYFKPDERPKKGKKKEKPNFYTRPGPKGTGSGYAGVTLGGEFPHLSEKYMDASERRRREEKASRSKAHGGVFRPTGSSGGGLFDSNPYAPYEPPKRKGKGRSKSAPARKVTVPFRPTSTSTRAVPGKTSHDHLFSTYKHKGSPYRDPGKDSRKAKPIGPAFRPNPPPKSAYTRSIADMNATRSITVATVRDAK